ncbi:MAG: molybdopterin-dependent oxidoreductase [Gammaproteobacteria bacterium]|nr:molybdopterin-dependent oxidoreductase [Gammaproteobacteria bacterium]
MAGIDFQRRRFLLNTGWIAAGVTVLSSCSNGLIPILPFSDPPAMSDSGGWVQFLPSGKVRFLCPRAEMGQGISVGLTQVVAAQMNIAPENIECVLPSTDQLAPVMSTAGSESMAEFFAPTVYGAALLCELLRKKAALKAGVQVEEVNDAQDSGGAFVTQGGVRIAYAELVSDEAIVLAEDDDISENLVSVDTVRRRIKAARDLNWNRPELSDIVTGRMAYSRDVEVPGMLYGQVLKAAPFGGKLGEVDLDAIQSMPGVVKAFIDQSKNCVCIICSGPFDLLAAVQSVETNWPVPAPYQQQKLDAVMDVEKYRGEDDFEHTIVEKGSRQTDSNADLDARGLKKIAARYKTPMAGHAAMEPRSAIVHFTPKKTEVWGASQNTHFVRDRVARITDQEKEQVTVYAHRLGGGFGGRILCQAAEEAALLSKSVAKPVRVQWSREDEFQHNPVQPQFDHHIEATITEDGRLESWEQHFTTSPIIFGSAVLPRHIQRIVDFTQEDGSPRGALPNYQIPNLYIRYSDIRTPLVTSAWRGLGAAPNTFAKECMVDELAAMLKLDPITLRIRNLGDEQKRLIHVLKSVADLSGWETNKPAPNYGFGVAATIYKQTPVAVVVEVYVDPSSHEIKVTRAWCAQDCGLVISPDQVIAQVQGNVVWGISMTLKESLKVKDGRYESTNFDSYSVARMSDAPDVEVKLVEHEGDPPIGAGEPALAPTPAAIANAVFAATGKRLRELPLSF